jgi:predicted metal-dependent hydrolase
MPCSSKAGSGLDFRGFRKGAESLQHDSVIWEATEISYRYYCSRRRRTLGISVYPDLSILVRAPFGTSQDVIRRFVLDRLRWIITVRRRFEQRIPPEPLRYRTGEIHHYAGKEHRLEVSRGQRDCVTCLTGRLLVTTRREPTEERTKKLLEAWYLARANILFDDRLVACHERAAHEGIPLPALRIRKMRTRWGTFSSKGVVTLNLLLVMMPIEYLDYVIFHELCHYKVRCHGPRFWNLLRRLLPDCDERRKKLNTYARMLGLP